ncbi:MAG: HDOD domain-containing protein [Gammaproteobacteria bacterium]|nr:HDOD domain-containing protein [Gammaproteobacteria bacterium]
MNLEDKEHNALLQISKRIEDGSLALPRMPEVVRKIDLAMSSENASMKEICSIIQYEPSISARIMQIANSPLIRGMSNITSLQSAVTRIGLDMVRNLVLCMGVKDSYKVRTSLLRNKMKLIWDDNTAIAMYSYTLARHLKMDADYAMIAGMLHSLGKLPIIDYANSNPEVVSEPHVLDYLIDTLHKPLGIKIIRNWEFDDEYIDVIENYDNFDKVRAGEVDLIDIITLAYCYRINTPDSPLDWFRVKPLRKLKLSADQLDKILQPTNNEFTEISQILFN